MEIIFLLIGLAAGLGLGIFIGMKITRYRLTKHLTNGRKG